MKERKPTSNEAWIMDMCHGLYCGMLDDMEEAILQAPLRMGWVQKVYTGAAGLLGLGKWQITPAGREALERVNETEEN